MPPPGLDPFAPFTPAEQATIHHATEDWAGNYHGQVGAVYFGRSDAERFVAEGHLKHLYPTHKLAEIWRAVAAHLDAHPEILQVGRLSDSEREARHQQRVDQAMRLDREALDAFTAGDLARARALIDHAEMAAPLHRPHHITWEDVRQAIDVAQDEADTAEHTSPPTPDQTDPRRPVVSTGPAGRDQEPDVINGHRDTPPTGPRDRR